MRLLMYCMMCLLCIACNQDDKKNKNQKESTYDQVLYTYLLTKPSREPSFLKFSFGFSKKQAIKHIDSLIKADKIEPRTTVTFSAVKQKADGWPYTLHLSNEQPVSTVFDLHYRNDSLYQISILPYGEIEESDIKTFLETQYGTASFAKIDTSSINKSDTIFFWFKNSYEISYSPRALSPIVFSDLRMKQRYLTRLKFIDSVKSNLKKDATDEAKNDFQ